MYATQILMEEHRVIERVLAALQTAAERVAQGQEMRPAFFINAALFIRNYADGSHHRKEEGILFVAMNKAGIPTSGGPIGVMLAEHEQGRAFTSALNDAAQKWEAGDLSARSAVVQNAFGYVALLQQHIQKEDRVLFPMADRAIPPDQQEQVNTDFEQALGEEGKAGIPEKYPALAEVLEKESRKTISSAPD
ncbi:MAG: hemerythrin domain-containing protein [Anaerolineales bacterium]|nr:hemerythrin domain-containing protein [Anaerolineales bacterium]